MDGFGDDYVLTPLVEAEDAMSPTGTEDDESAVAAEDYVQSLVTIESNWANGKKFNLTFPVHARMVHGLSIGRSKLLSAVQFLDDTKAEYS